MSGSFYVGNDPYYTAHEFLHTRGKPVPRKKVSNNTYLERRGTERIALVLHATDVVTYGPETVTLNTGGWLTVTTKDRINYGLPSAWSVTSTKGTWELREGGWSNTRTVLRYTDGITLVRTGDTWEADPRTCLPVEQRERDDAHNKSMRALIGKYVKAITSDTIDEAHDSIDEAHDSAAGDCILCRITEERDAGRGADRPVLVSIGDKMGDTQHLTEHLLEGYLTSALILAALSESGYIPHPHHGVATVKRTVRRYLAKRLYVGAAASHNGRTPVAAA